MSEQGFSVKISARIDQYLAAVSKAQSATRSLGDEGGRAASQLGQSMQKLGTHMENVGRKMTSHVSLPILAVGGAAVKASADFERAFAQMQGLAGVTADEIDGLKESVLSLSGRTAQSPQALAEALYFAKSAGLDTADAMKAVESAAKASAAGMGSAADVVGLVASATAAYGAANITAAEATDVLTSAIREGRADPDELAGTLGRVLPIASQLGITFDEVGGTIAYLSNVFGDTNRSVTAMQGVFVKLLTPSKQGSDALKEMGTSAAELQSAIDANGLTGALDLLREHGFAGNQQALRALFDDIEGFQGALALLNDESGRLVPTLDKVRDSAGSLDVAFAAVSDTAGFKLKQAWADVQVALIQAGDIILPILSGVAGAVADVVGAFADMSPAAQNAVLGTLGAFAAIGPIASIVGAVINNLRILQAVMSTLAAHPMLIVAAGIGVAAAALLMHESESEKAAKRAKEFYSAVKGGLGTLDLQRIAVLDVVSAMQEYGDAIYADADKQLRELITTNQSYTKVLGILGLTLDDVMAANRGGAEAQDLLTKARQRAVDTGLVLVDSSAKVHDELLFGAEAADAAAAATQRWIDTGTTGAGVQTVATAAYGAAEDQVLSLVTALENQAGASYDSAEAAANLARIGDVQAIAYLKVTGQLDLLSIQERRVALAALDAAEAGEKQGAAAAGAGPLMERLTASLFGASDAAETTGFRFSDLTTSLFGTTTAGERLKRQQEANEQAAKDLITQIAKSTTVFDELRTAANMLDTALRSVTGGQMSLETNTRTLFANMDELKGKVGEATAAEDAFATSLDIATAAGRSNRADIQQQAEAILARAGAMIETGSSVEEAAGEVNRLTEDFKNQLTAMGFNRAEVDAYLTSLGMTPENVATSVQLVGDEIVKGRLTERLEQLGEIDAGAEAEIAAAIDTNQFDEAERLINAIDTSTATVIVTADTSAAASKISALLASVRSLSRGANADVGLLPHGASGGVIPGPVGAPFPMVAHGGEILVPTGEADLRRLLADPAVSGRLVAALGGSVMYDRSGGISSQTLARFNTLAGSPAGAFLAPSVGPSPEPLSPPPAVANPSAGPTEAQLARRRFDRGETDPAAYRASLEQRRSALELYSDEEQRLWDEIQALDNAKATADERAAADAARLADEKVAADRRAAEQRIAHEDEVQKFLYESGQITAAEYQAHLMERQLGYELYSADWFRVTKEIDAVKAASLAADQKAADEAAKQSAAQIAQQDTVQKFLYDSGQITLEQYQAYLASRQGSYEQYSTEWFRITREMMGLQTDLDRLMEEFEDAKRKERERKERESLDRIGAMYDAARNRKAYGDAAAEAEAAIADLGSAEAATRARGLSAEDRAGALADFERAKAAAAEALYRRADAAANNAGIADNTPEWATAVRAALMGDQANAPVLAAAIDRILSGIPSFAVGGRIPGALGSPQLLWGHGGEHMLTAEEAPMWQRFISGQMVAASQYQHTSTSAGATYDQRSENNFNFNQGQPTVDAIARALSLARLQR